MCLARQEMGEEAMLVNSRRSQPEARHLGAYEVVFAASQDPALEGIMRTASGTSRGAFVLGGLLAVAVLGGPAGPATARVALMVLAPVNLMVEGLKWSVIVHKGPSIKSE